MAEKEKKQDVEIKEMDFYEFIKGAIDNGFKTKCLYDVQTIKIENAHPDVAEIRKHSSEVIKKLIEEYKPIENKTSKEIIAYIINTGKELYDKKVMPNIAVYDNKNIKNNTPEELLEMAEIMQRLSYLQNLFILHNIKLLIETTMESDADWFVKFADENKTKINTMDFAWDIYMVISCIIPFKFGYFNVEHDFGPLKSMTAGGKQIPDFFCVLAQQFGLITVEERALILQYIKDNNASIKQSLKDIADHLKVN